MTSRLRDGGQDHASPPLPGAAQQPDSDPREARGHLQGYEMIIGHMTAVPAPDGPLAADSDLVF